MILISFALPFESAGFRRTLRGRQSAIIHTGIGTDAARSAITKGIETHRPSLVVSSGFAGGLAEDLAIAEIVVASESIDVPDFRRGVFATSSNVVATSTEKRRLAGSSGADAVDMESEAVRDVCREAGIRLIILRAISDRVEDDLAMEPELLAALACGRLTAFPKLGWMLVSDAGRRRRFAEMLRNSRKAQRALADGLGRLLEFLEEREVDEL